MLIELVVSSKHKSRHGNRVAMGASIALAAAIEAICTIIFEGSNHLTIASDAEAIVRVNLGRIGVPLRRSSRGRKQQSCCSHSSHNSHGSHISHNSHFICFRLQRYADLPFLAIRKNYDFALSEPIPTYLIMMKLMPLEHECSIFSFQFSIKILTFAAK